MPTIWDRLRDPSCDRCSIANRAEIIAPVSGKGTSNILFVLPPPSIHEEQYGRDLVGPAGVLFRELLLAVDWPYAYSVSHATWCRPKTGTPTVKQTGTCSHHFLRRAIIYLAPRMIICMGVAALQAVLGPKDPPNEKRMHNVKEHRRKILFVERKVRDRSRTGFKKRKRIPVIGTYAPGQIHQQPHLRQVVIEDLAFIRQYIDTGKGMVSDERDRVYRLQGKDETFGTPGSEATSVSVDVETTSFSPWDAGAKILCVAVSDQALHADAFTLSNAPLRKQLRRFLARKACTIIGHNLLFDLTWLTWLGYKIRGPVFDTLVAFHLLAETYPDKSLAHLARLYLPGLAGYEGQMKGERGKFEKVTRELLAYNAADADATTRLKRLFYMRIKKEGLLDAFRLRMNALKCLVKIQVNGMSIDGDRMDQAGELNEKKIKRIEKWFKEKVNPTFNLASHVQVRELVFSKMGMRVAGRTDSGLPSTNERSLRRVLRRIRDKKGTMNYTVISRILKHREYTQMQKMFFHAYRKNEFIKPDSRIHASYSLSVTATGRVSCSKPNVQQVPESFRTLFPSRFEDGKIIKVDQSQMELRVLAHMSGDPFLRTAFKEGKDIHTETAASIFEIPDWKVSKEQRYLAKTINFGVLYGMSDKRLAAEAEMDLLKARDFLKRYWSRLPDVEEWVREQKRSARLKKYTKSLFGVKRRFDLIDPDTKEGQAAFREAVNHPIQSSASDINLVCLVEMDYHLESMQSCIINTTHDDILIDCHPEEVDDILVLAQEVCENPPLSRYGVELSVPLEVEVAIGPTWGELEKV